MRHCVISHANKAPSCEHHHLHLQLAQSIKTCHQNGLDQTFEDFEYLIVGDHCTDNTEQTVQEFNDPRIRWFNLECHQGNQANVNQFAHKHTRGELIAYLNHDDLWLPTHLEHLVALFRASPDLRIANSLCLEISPPPYLYRSILGLPREEKVPIATGEFVKREEHNLMKRIQRLAQRIGQKLGGTGTATQAQDQQTKTMFTNTPMTSTIMHRNSAGIAAGGWDDWRETHEIPTQDFFRRLRELQGGFAVLGEVTAMKFHSGDRRKSYSMGQADEQAYVLAQIQNDHQWLANQLAVAALCDSLKLTPTKLPQPQRPADAPFGWQIEQWRRMRGLPPLIHLGSSEPDESLMQLPPPTPLLRSCRGVTSFWRPDSGLRPQARHPQPGGE